MNITNQIFIEWMRLPGLVKKLQFFLLLSVLFNLLLLQQLIVRVNNKTTMITNVKLEQSPIVEITEADLKSFVKLYLENFFAINVDAETFLRIHSEKELFSTIQVELLNRRNLKIVSHLQINDLYLDSVSDKLAKAIVLGEEVFASGIGRKITIELLISTDVLDKEHLLVKSIPVLEIVN